MPTLDYLLLAVKDPQRSATLYDKVLGAKPVENSPTLVLYVLPNGFKLGLWSGADMQPAPGPAGGVELSFSLPSEAAVRQTFAACTSLGLKAVQEPTQMDFGFTAVVADPDGHRLRPFVLAEDRR